MPGWRGEGGNKYLSHFVRPVYRKGGKPWNYATGLPLGLNVSDVLGSLVDVPHESSDSPQPVFHGNFAADVAAVQGISRGAAML